MPEYNDIYTETVNDCTFRMKRVAGGTFVMGDDKGGYDDEKPAHSVRVPDFYIGVFPVTQALWKAVMGAENNPSFFRGEDRPVENVSWNDIVIGDKGNNIPGFLEKLNKLTGKNYRLPTEAEWEYAARGGNLSKGYSYAGSNLLTAVGWYSENSHNETKPVGLKNPNELGLYDMSGNVWEWCEDTWYKDYNGAPDDGTVWVDKNGSDRVNRGGSWYYDLLYARCANRDFDHPSLRNVYIGFRLSRTK